MNLMFFLFILANIEKQFVLCKILCLLHFQSPTCNTTNTSSMYHKTGYHPTYDKASFIKLTAYLFLKMLYKFNTKNYSLFKNHNFLLAC